jgi:small subunit ribosomal protein S6
MRQYEVTFIVDPVLSGDEIKSTAKTYEDLLTNEKCSIVAKDEHGLKPLAYTINKRNSGIYFTHEFQTPTGAVIPKLELALRRDERIMRFLTVKLDKYGVKFNDDKRNGKIGGKKEKADKEKKEAEKKAEVKADDLTKIEGIGPKIGELLVKAGVATYTDLAKSSADTLKDILTKGGSTFASHDPTTWPQQSDLAAAGKWDELKTLQDELDGGKVVSSSEEE